MGRVTVHRASEAGFCFGVRRAIELARETAAQYGSLRTHGLLVHNDRVLETLRAENIHPLNEGETPDCAVLIRAHGITSAQRRQLEASGQLVIDATCPMVAAIKHAIDRELDAGALVLVAGKPGHPEALGLKDGRDDVRIIAVADDLDEPGLLGEIRAAKQVALVAQSTTLIPVFEQCRERLMKLRPDATIRNTICKPTTQRQTAVLELARRLPLIVVVGDSKSANTGHLVEAAARYTKAVRVDGPEDLQPEWFDGISDVGLTAGASTPDEIIEAVVAAIEAFG